MHAASVWAGIASLISLVFSIQLVIKYGKKHKPFHLWWGIAMLLYTISAAAEGIAPVTGWSAAGYRIYYFCAISLVVIMSVGQMFMSFSERTARNYLRICLILLIAFLVFLLREPLLMDRLQQTIGTVAGEGMAAHSIPRIVFAPILDGVGGILLIVLPIWSWWKSRHAAPIYVAVGSLLLSMAGSITHLGLQDFLPLAELLGIAIIYLGVIRSTEPKRIRQNAIEQPEYHRLA